uniref:Uncharacterized protein n=1 Tax=Piliocolobus tephrosceles TaxID=591936 RepID=A0A8C9HWH1_9PRIM
MTQELSFQKFIEQSDLLRELKYDFNEKAEFRHTETQRPFVFNYYENVLEKNSKRYQALVKTRCLGHRSKQPQHCLSLYRVYNGREITNVKSVK